MTPHTIIHSIKDYLLTLQKDICTTISSIDGQQQFVCDEWTRPTGGGGLTCVLCDGQHIEKAGVNFSHVSGEQLPPSASSARPHLAGSQFKALGLSLIIHPKNPYAPTTHANLRYFVAQQPGAKSVWWFGGGFDLTPFYGFREDATHWHQTAQQACLPFGEEVYPKYKKWADEYFFLRHRNEARGIGGLFFDDLNTWPLTQCFDFIKSVGGHFLPAYLPILQKRIHMPFGARERDFQCYRRGRYVEFNLLYDRGTLFGLHSGGRTESILVSLPPVVHWNYNWQAENQSPEAELTEYFLQPQSWI